MQTNVYKQKYVHGTREQRKILFYKWLNQLNKIICVKLFVENFKFNTIFNSQNERQNIGVGCDSDEEIKS